MISSRSLVFPEAENRLWAAVAALEGFVVQKAWRTRESGLPLLDHLALAWVQQRSNRCWAAYMVIEWKGTQARLAVDEPPTAISSLRMPHPAAAGKHLPSLSQYQLTQVLMAG
ncbi:Ornithine carbamoyltransferase like protein [Verticillium longisporum]|nr:Ornithine carbamoyltransferase like protein [Verticillium longisporum]